MNGYFPQSLYKYYEPERVDVLKKLKVRLTPIGELNDPFEGRPRIDGNGVLDENDRFWQVTDLMDQSSAPFDPEIREALSYAQVAALTNARDQLSADNTYTAKYSIGTLVHDFYTGEIDKKIGVFCMSEVNDNQLRWAHYGKSHTGFAIELDSKHAFFHGQRSEDDDFRSLRRVIYRDTRPSIRAEKASVIDLMLTKSSSWVYERE